MSDPVKSVTVVPWSQTPVAPVRSVETIVPCSEPPKAFNHHQRIDEVVDGTVYIKRWVGRHGVCSARVGPEGVAALLQTLTLRLSRRVLGRCPVAERGPGRTWGSTRRVLRGPRGDRRLSCGRRTPSPPLSGASG